MKIVSSLFLTLLLASQGWADVGEYVTIAHARIYERPDKHARIIHDFPKFRRIDAEPVSQEWGKVWRLGESDQEADWCSSRESHSEETLFKNGKYAPFQFMPCRIVMFPKDGYVRMENITRLESPELLPIPLGGYHSADSQWWEPVGVQDDRRIIADIDRHPYNAVVRVLTQGLEQAPYYGAALAREMFNGNIESCSGTFMYTKTVILTAHHCIDNVNAPVTVRLERGIDRYEDISGHIVRYDKEVDWAVIKLDHVPKFPIDPLEFAERVNWGATFAFRSIAVGYPDDLHMVSRATLGFVTPVLSTCAQVGRSFRSIHSNLDNHTMALNIPCTIWQGNSGGPLLVWDAAARRFAVLAVYVINMNVKSIATMPSYSESEQEQARIARLIQHFFTDDVFKNNSKILSPETDIVKGPLRYLPNIASLTRAAGWPRGQARVGRDVISAVRMTAGLPDLTEEYWEDPQYLGTFLQRGIAINWHAMRNTMRMTCTSVCTALSLNPEKQQSWTLGDRLTTAQLKKVHKLYITVELENGRVGVIIGGDVFNLRPNQKQDTFEVIGVIREFMKLRRYISRTSHAASSIQKLGLTHGVGRDYGVEPETNLRSTDFGQPTPTTVAGGTVIGTKELRDKLMGKQPPIVIAAMDDPYGIPFATALGYASQGGSFDDAAQKEAGGGTEQIVRRR